MIWIGNKYVQRIGITAVAAAVGWFIRQALIPDMQLLLHRRVIAGYKTDLQGKLLLTLKIDVSETPAVSKEKAAAFKRWFAA